MGQELIDFLVTGGTVVLILAALFLIIFTIRGGWRK
jgi:cell division protein FtsX